MLPAFTFQTNKITRNTASIKNAIQYLAVRFLSSIFFVPFVFIFPAFGSSAESRKHISMPFVNNYTNRIECEFKCAEDLQISF